MSTFRARRIAGTGMTLCLAAFGLLVAFNNLTDYGSNFLFVRHVLSMDDTLPGNALSWRALHRPWEWHAAYLAIIAGELATGLLFAAAGVSMALRHGADAAGFAWARRRVPYGCLAAFLVWFLGFFVVGGEWFAMWQSPHWNGQEAAFRFLVVVLAVTLYVDRPE